MKKSLLTSFLFALFYSVVAQTNTFPTSGNVGIGTTSPGVWFIGKTLEIRDERPTFRLSPSWDGGVGTIAFKGSWQSESQSADEFHLNYVSSSVNSRLVLVNFHNGAEQKLLTIKADGSIGVGTETPTAKLSVNGNIRAKEVKVETANWPDYVFAKDYQLPSLKETEKHIKERGHLPGIPSANEVEANGVNLGEMNAKLLKKIEELTLYMIEQEKKINIQSELLKILMQNNKAY